MLPTTAQVVDITLGGKPEKLFFSFRAWHTLGVNPLKPEEVKGFLDSLSPTVAADWILAGLGGYQALRHRLSEPGDSSVEHGWDRDGLLDILDTSTFGAIVAAIGAAAGVTPGTAESAGNG